MLFQNQYSFSILVVLGFGCCALMPPWSPLGVRLFTRLGGAGWEKRGEISDNALSRPCKPASGSAGGSSKSGGGSLRSGTR